MRVLVTGGSGFIGTNLMRSFIERGVHVLNVDWNPPLDLEQRPWWRRTDIMDQAATMNRPKNPRSWTDGSRT